MRKFPTDNFAAFAYAGADILIEVDNTGKIVFCDGATQGLLQKSSDALVGKPFLSLISEVHHKRVKNLMHALKRVYRADAVQLNLSLQNGRFMPFRVSGVFVDHLDGRFYLSLRSEEHMQSPNGLDHRDTETGLLDKEIFAVKAGAHIKDAAQRGEHVEVTLLDFPGLQELLDTLTPKQSEQLMGAIGDYLKSKSLDGDSAATIDRGSYSIIHPGGLNTDTIISDIQHIARTEISPDIRLDIKAKTIKTDSDEYPLSSHDTANAVLYTMNKFAQTHGGSFTIESLNESYEEMLDSTLEHIAAFRKTLSDDAFDLAFQPIVNIRDGKVHHHECLVRLHEGAGFGNPFEFITFGEQSSLIAEFDMVVAEKAFELIASHKAQQHDIKLAINISGKSLSSNLFMDTFLNLMRDNASLRRNMIIEITESYKIENMQIADDFVQTLRKEGSLVCLDDFGSGESSFDYLRHLQVDFVKIDGSYVRESMQNDRGRSMLKAMAGLCRALNITAIGEMVETHKEALFLHECGVQYGQGYMFGKPDTSEEVLHNNGKIMPNFPGIVSIRTFKEVE
jgi:EAL domain-containing protein (putative c-di-GMP-specific phosphodiesterase class I)